MSEDSRLRRIEFSHEIERMDIEQRFRDARESGWAEGEARGRAEGEAKGEARGKAEGKAELITNMAAKGLDTAQIADLIGLSETDVLAILA
jgi:predicted transposase/invertase (TIGR01784 family)